MAKRFQGLSLCDDTACVNMNSTLIFLFQTLALNVPVAWSTIDPDTNSSLLA